MTESLNQVIQRQQEVNDRLKSIIDRALQQFAAIEHEMDGWTTAPGSLFEPVKRILKEASD
jgi:hypothetical protein